MQSLILVAICMTVGFQVVLIGLLADLVGSNRRLLEETLYRQRKAELTPDQPGDQGAAQENRVDLEMSLTGVEPQGPPYLSARSP